MPFAEVGNRLLAVVVFLTDPDEPGLDQVEAIEIVALLEDDWLGLEAVGACGLGRLLLELVVPIEATEADEARRLGDQALRRRIEPVDRGGGFEV